MSELRQNGTRPGPGPGRVRARRVRVPGIRTWPLRTLDIPSQGMAHGYAENKDQVIKRLHRVEGQVRGIERMVEDDRYCIDVLTQISAVSTALESVALKILDDHVNHCVVHALASGDREAAGTKTRELLEAVRRFARMR